MSRLGELPPPTYSAVALVTGPYTDHRQVFFPDANKSSPSEVKKFAAPTGCPLNSYNHPPHYHPQSRAGLQLTPLTCSKVLTIINIFPSFDQLSSQKSMPKQTLQPSLRATSTEIIIIHKILDCKVNKLELIYPF